MAVVGGSFTAGVGASAPDQSWAYLLADEMGWRAAVRGDPGAGYVRRGRQGRGPMSRLLSELDLPRLRPAMVIIQAGHNDIGAPLAQVAADVDRDITMVHAEDPGARVVLITVFIKGNRISPAARRTNATIITAAHVADSAVIVLNPLDPRWVFGRVRDRLHPDETGDEEIANKVAEVLMRDGVPSYGYYRCDPNALGRSGVPGPITA
jgi:lysophospholipase L1-like esterase